MSFKTSKVHTERLQNDLHFIQKQTKTHQVFYVITYDWLWKNERLIIDSRGNLQGLPCVSSMTYLTFTKIFQ
jgi:hypothetical protein